MAKEEKGVDKYEVGRGASEGEGVENVKGGRV